MWKPESTLESVWGYSYLLSGEEFGAQRGAHSRRFVIVRPKMSSSVRIASPEFSSLRFLLTPSAFTQELGPWGQLSQYS